MKKGFGLIEVLIAAVVLGFLIIGLNRLQLGNREGVLRVRARDAANTIAQDIIDSISAIPSASVVTGNRVCDNQNNKDLCKKRTFEGETGKIDVDFLVTVNVAAEDANKVVNNETQYIKALGNANKLSVKHQIAKQIDVTVKWKFKNSDQSINVSSLVK